MRVVRLAFCEPMSQKRDMGHPAGKGQGVESKE
jgi:hypothetical protein